MLKKLRVILAVVLTALITFFFLDFAGILSANLHVLEHFQFVPALLGLNLIFVFLLVLTLFFGRIYCSVICPLGVFQDFANWISQKTKRKKRFKFTRAKNILRWAVLALTIVAFLFGFNFFVGFIDPYSIFGRITVHIFRPAYQAGNNLLAAIFTNFDNYTFYTVSIYISSIFSFIVALVSLIIIGVMAWTNGRAYCNTICPVGTVLGFASRFSLFKMRIDAEKCNSCGVCAMKCKASCIDAKNHAIDYSRCVACFDCENNCKRGAMKYGYSKFHKLGISEKPIDSSKRQFLLSAGALPLAAVSITAQNTVSAVKKAQRTVPIMPPGAKDIDYFRKKCTSCHLCVSKCPSRVLKPAFLDYGLGGIMQPMLDFQHGFCNYDCTLCGELCPTNAINRLSQEEKNKTQTGKVQFVRENCIVYKDETFCGACSEHCPTQAVSMVDYKNGLTIPKTDTNICVGCGGCEFICPAAPQKAIFVQGLEKQNVITIIQDEKKEVEIDDFGF